MIEDEPFVDTSAKKVDLELLLAFSRTYGVIESYRLESDLVVMSSLGVNYRARPAQAMEIVFRLLRERPPLADLAQRLCRI